MCCYRFEPFQFDPEAGQLHGPHGEIRLRPQAFHVLRELLEQHPRVLSHDELLDRVWGAAHISTNSLPQVVSELRQALGDSAQAPRFITTVHRRGYRFVAPLEKHMPTDPPADATTSVKDAPPPPPDGGEGEDQLSPPLGLPPHRSLPLAGGAGLGAGG